MRHRSQARVPEGTLVTVWLAYSGVAAHSNPIQNVDGDERKMSAAAMEKLLERVKRMPNVRVVEPGET